MKKTIEADILDSLNKLQQQLAVLEKKMDAFMPRQPQAPHQQPHRQLFKAVCADCGSECEVPFKPTGERPVYCKNCFSKRKGGGNSFKPQVQAVHFNKADRHEPKKKFYERVRSTGKRSSPKRRKGKR